MPEWPDVSVLIPTFNRATIVRRTVELLRLNLRYSGSVRFIVGCDGSDNTPEMFREPDTEVIPEPSGSLGANLNRLHEAAWAHGCAFTVSLDDDHWLMNPLGLDDHIARLRGDESAGWVHLLVDAVGDEDSDGYRFCAHLDGRHWRLEYDSPDEWPCSFRAHLSHRRFHEAAGPFAEGLQSGRTEYEFNQRAKALGKAGKLPSVLVPLCAYGFNWWAHVGRSWNRRGL